MQLLLSDSTLITGVTVAPMKGEGSDCHEVLIADGSNSRILILKNCPETELSIVQAPNVKSLIVQSSIMEGLHDEPVVSHMSNRGFPLTTQCEVFNNGVLSGVGELSFSVGYNSPEELLPALLVANAENYELVLVKVFPGGKKVFKTSDSQEVPFVPVSEEVHQIDCMSTRFINLRRSALHLPGRQLQPDCLCIFEQGKFNIEPIGFMADEEATL